MKMIIILNMKILCMERLLVLNLTHKVYSIKFIVEGESPLFSVGRDGLPRPASNIITRTALFVKRKMEKISTKNYPKIRRFAELKII